MEAERWRQIDQLFHSALERPPGERAAFLAEACLDEALRREVESLLASHGQGESFLETAAFDLAVGLLKSNQPQPVTGRTLGPYQVLSLLGRGGMGEVYLAQDTRLGRRVALKLLPAQFTQDADRVRRFEQEARAASALNHPNIITIHEVWREGGLHFIVTEFIDGETLRQRMAGGQMALRETLEVAIQVASALAAAHEAGIVHRDIKPENVMVRRDGYVKVLDFGLAKLIDPLPAKAADSDAPTSGQVHTDPGRIMGTLRYMSPEQLRGQQGDGRTDIFSLGVMLYEMVAGCPPFEDANSGDLIAAILGQEAPPLARYFRQAPAELERIVSKALAKNREDRYQGAKDFLIDLKGLRLELDVEAKLKRAGRAGSSAEVETASGEQPVLETAKGQEAATDGGSLNRPVSSAEYLINQIRGHRRGVFATLVALVLAVAGFTFYAGRYRPIDSIAVLPLVNESGDQNAEYLSDGITDSLITSLSQLPKLRVRAQSTVLRYKGQRVEPERVGRDLGVRAVLTGKMSKGKGVLNIEVELVDVADGSALWAAHYQWQFADLFAAQGEIAREISEKLRLRLTGEEQKRLVRHYTEDPEAYQLYLNGRFYYNQRTEEGLKTGINYFNQAIAKDSKYALAYAGLADAYILGENFFPPGEAMRQAKAAADTALKFDDTLAEAHTSLAAVKMLYEWDWPGAERGFKRAVELRPWYLTAHHWYAEYLTALGRYEEALAEIKQARNLDPVSLVINRDLGRHYYFAQQYDQAVNQFRNTLDLDPKSAGAHAFLGLTYVKKEMFEKAITELVRAADLSPSGNSKAMLGYAYALSNRKDEAQQVLASLHKLPQEESASPYWIAVVYGALGDKERAFAWLEKAYQEHSSPLAYLKVHPTLDSLRPDPRFRDLERRVGLPD